MTTITESEFRADPRAALYAEGPITVVNAAGEPVLTIGGPQVAMGTVETVGRDPADDAAWPLPDGWRWSLSSIGEHIAFRSGGSTTAWVTRKGALETIEPIPLDVVRTLLARWEAGQA